MKWQNKLMENLLMQNGVNIEELRNEHNKEIGEKPEKKELFADRDVIKYVEKEESQNQSLT